MNHISFFAKAGRRALALGMGLLAAGLLQAMDLPLQAHLNADAGRLTFTFRGQKVLVYAFSSNQFKPYVQALYDLKGDNVLLDSPPDHVHHHGLMYAIKVNGINFWEEKIPDPGVEEPIALPGRGISASGQPPYRGFITQTIYWVSSKHRYLPDPTPAALLMEQRTLILTVNEARQEVSLRWHSDFQVGKAARRVVLSGTPYDGLGIRFPRDWDHVAHHLNSAHHPYSAEQTGDVIRAHWAATTHTVNGHGVTVALFSRPTNPGTSKFFSMLNPFAYLSATQGLDRKPIRYKRGALFSLNYLVLVYPETKTWDSLNQRYARWLKQ